MAKTLPAPTVPCRILAPLAGRACRYLLVPFLVAKGFTKNVMKVWKGTGRCPVSACVTQKRVRSLDITKKIQWADFCSLAPGQFLSDPWEGSVAREQSLALAKWFMGFLFFI